MAWILGRGGGVNLPVPLDQITSPAYSGASHTPIIVGPIWMKIIQPPALEGRWSISNGLSSLDSFVMKIIRFFLWSIHGVTLILIHEVSSGRLVFSLPASFWPCEKQVIHKGSEAKKRDGTGCMQWWAKDARCEPDVILIEFPGGHSWSGGGGNSARLSSKTILVYTNGILHFQ